ncbi:MAG: MFS transporter [Gammaproteobacteria bacterium]|nr:MFS transporter [Gammaproteobacteria bacterium]MDP6537633.1 MFS transporter [Gammaproteobacteria bacterium]MDP6732945.1 MFS transporter [Gammaproteobacteria bacterium]HAJ75103.1 MFS transporter [Gammaproteobacteria bacterium]
MPTVDNPYDSSATRNYALVLLTIVYAFNFIDRQLLSVLQESIKVDLSLSDSQLGLLTGFAFAMFYVSAGIPIARWADRGNRRNIVAMSVGIWSFMTAISGFAQNYAQLLVARIGVGIGEAGGSPPSHSIVSDIFPPARRASALAFYSMGVNMGVLFGFLLGGWLNEFFGWRVAFIVVGVPGILLALLVRGTIKDPVRGLIENKKVSDAQASIVEVVSLLWKRRTFRHLALAGGLNAFAGYGHTNWATSFFIRSHEMTTGELGTWLALSSGLCAAIGVFGGGLLADKLAPRDKRWYMWIPAIATLLCVPPMFVVYLAGNQYVALIFAFIPGLFHNVYLGCSIATTHGLVGLRMRATASAIFLLVINVIGLGLGPFLVGFFSDSLEPSFGSESLRYAMVTLLPAIMLWSTWHFYYAARSIKDDLATAPD